MTRNSRGMQMWNLFSTAWPCSNTFFYAHRCDVDLLLDTLCTRTIQIREGSIVKALDCNAAVASRDALAKTVYARLFGLLIRLIYPWGKIQIPMCKLEFWTSMDLNALSIIDYDPLSHKHAGWEICSSRCCCTAKLNTPDGGWRIRSKGKHQIW
ncbi:uncharacterized protein [Gossypium hirsutum]|uniref:Uncharacterized protein isoform X1 n=1 Tax=Gossypium hirsutum TaxID=3635 RepID=A0ABM3B573_GOSHI|nr:uncharacterized protein LOC107912477 isoform X1 [Gossypium hirsutum]XP_040962186.1 uncharacterized protein LOC107912477 isoform X1 [Gossypium hirsutum]XP_040962187.1 uncharacterized protein LOC107912477 isoform X1 [Gossypium hirsutum]